MTTTETTDHAGSPQPPFGIATLEAGPTCTGIMPSGIFCIGALAAPDGQFLYLSLLGRDTAFQELRGKMTTGQLHAFIVQQDGKTVASGWFSREVLGRMEYHGAKVQTHLFGEVAQMILYHPLLTTPDKATQTVALPYLGQATAQTLRDTWQLVRHICEVPLLDEWQAVVMPLLVDLQWLQPLQGFGCNASYLKLGSNIGGLVSANIRSGALRVAADEAGRLCIPERMTLDLEYGLAKRHPQQATPPPGNSGGGFWDDADVISVYTRQQAIADGVLVDVSASSEARDAGFKVPVALTEAVYQRFVAWDNNEVRPEQQALGQSTAGRLWDVLYMASLAIRRSSNQRGDSTLRYELYVIERDGFSTTPRSIKLKLHSGSGDHGEHVITIMLPEED